MRQDLEDRRREIRSTWSDWQPTTLADHFDACAERWPDANVVISNEGETTYRELADLSWRFAAGMARKDVARGDRVGLVMRGSADFLAAKIAAARLGAIAVPINYLLSAPELTFVIDGSRPKIVIAYDTIGTTDNVDLLTKAGLLNGASNGPVVVVRSSGSLPAGAESLTEFLGDTAEVKRDQLNVWTGEPEIAEILYTSGSTGIAKGVMLRHQSLLREAFGSAVTRAFAPGWRTMTALPTFHLFGWAQAVLPMTFVGGCLIVREKFDPETELDLVSRLGVQDIVCVPSMLHGLVDVAESKQPPLDSLQAIFAAGDPVPEELWIRARNALGVNEITNGYGMTELSGTCFMLPPDATDEQLATSVGMVKLSGHVGIQELGGAQHAYRIVDPGTSTEVAEGEVGEIQYRGPNLFAGYWNNEQETKRVFTNDGWFCSGDMGRMRSDGGLVLTGRIKDLYRTGGELVSPSELESVIGEMDGVSSAYVVGVKDVRWGEIGWAFVVPVPDGSLSVDAIVEYCRTRLAKYKVPRQVRIIAQDNVPKTASGKVKKAGLIKIAEAEAFAEH